MLHVVRNAAPVRSGVQDGDTGEEISVFIADSGRVALRRQDVDGNVTETPTNARVMTPGEYGGETFYSLSIVFDDEIESPFE